MRNRGQRVVLVSRQAQRISELLADRAITVVPVKEVAGLRSPSLTLVQGTSGRRLGAQGEESGSRSPFLHVLTDAEVFGWARPVPGVHAGPARWRPRPFCRRGTRLLRGPRGAWHWPVPGPGQDGIERRRARVPAGGVCCWRQALRARLPGRPPEPIRGGVGSGPRINRLGTAEWEQVKARAKKAVEEIADDLLVLYAAREVVEGHAFSSDTLWQAELEASFPYVETDAQIRALDEIKADMEQPRPMDRLVCGDVGYGKTEVALRAAFKAVMDGKQVALLVPTTVLAQQHYQTFASVSALSGFGGRCSPVSLPEAAGTGGRASGSGGRGHCHRHPPPVVR